MRLTFAAILTASTLFSISGCAAPDDAVDGDESEVVSVKDLAALEKELGLVKDVKDAKGRYARSTDKIAQGKCYKRTYGSASQQEFQTYQFRRYTQGIAVFSQKGMGVASGDARPVVCLDIDTRDGKIADIGRLELDSIVRYHLGAEEATGATGITFQRGTFELASAVPAKTTHTISTPVFRGKWFTKVRVGKTEIDAGLVSLVQRYAWNKAAGDDDFSFAKDPFGKFVSAAKDASGEHVMFERLAAHRIVSEKTGTEALFVTKKGVQGPAFAASAIASCTRSIGVNGARGKFECVGLIDRVSVEAAEAALKAGCTTCSITLPTSMRGVSLGMTPAQVRKVLGTPTAISTYHLEERSFFTTYSYGLTDFDIYDGKVVHIATYSSKVKTAKGLGVGATAKQVKALVPGAVGDSAGPFVVPAKNGGPITELLLDEGTVYEIGVATEEEFLHGGGC